jgi:hypothetical protein
MRRGRCSDVRPRFPRLLQNVFPALPMKCSTTGPNASAGKNVSKPTIRITAVSNTTQRRLVVGNVPRLSGAEQPCVRVGGSGQGIREKEDLVGDGSPLPGGRTKPRAAPGESPGTAREEGGLAIG